ncbi:TetR family transcriptional regulator C-terminal domain-containing protein [Myxococcus sp. K15C18031901]|uniref:TetR/AcrR family transcriptional regulator n=1 Tax=Myxococcus dinghuensis TaxID=2906761 RepID=UPI0020A7B926|nr:TetR/AcrR family transcriptional regulator [Myxococcus dinghuensis]MCP3100142.1 TetR family transcriptional regulator C-terminal domain-containing protein [Myxococcus dinghuensis]
MGATAATGADVRRHILEAAHPLVSSKGFTAVGLSEILAVARMPKGSSYYYFDSKEAFGEAVLEASFTDYLSRMDDLLARPGTAAQRLPEYFQGGLESQVDDAASGRCLVVKLGAEVCDLAERMRAALERGTQGTIDRLARCLEEGRGDGSVPALPDARAVAASLYQSWLGAGLRARISRSRAPLDTAMTATRLWLGLTPST